MRAVVRAASAAAVTAYGSRVLARHPCLARNRQSDNRRSSGSGGAASPRRRLAYAAPPDEIDDRQQDQRADERHDKPGNTEVVLIDGACTKQRRDEPAAQDRADDADDD